MSLSTITLPTNKSISVVDDDRRRIRQSEKGLSLPVILLNADGSAYDLTDKKLVFSEEKVGDKIVVDDGGGRDSGTITITDAKAGKFTYTLQEQVYVESGTCWFEILTGDTVVDTTKNFYFDVDKDATIHPINDSYISRLVALEDHLQGSIQKAEESIGQVSTNLTNTANKAKQDAINAINDAKANAENTLQQLQNQYNDYQNRYNDLQNQWNQQKQKIQSDADNQRNQIKAENDRARQDAINQINSARDNAIAQANHDFTDRINSLQNDYIAWKNRTVADFNSTAKTIMDKINQQNANVDGVKKQMADIQAQINNVLNKFSSVDFTKFIKQEDLARSGTNLLRNTQTLAGFGSYTPTNHSGMSIENISTHSSETNINLIRTSIAHTWGTKMMDAGVGFGQALFLPAGTYTLSFMARCNGTPNGRGVSLFSDYTDAHNGNSLVDTPPLTETWQEYTGTFTIDKAGTYGNWRIACWLDDPVPGGSLYFANIKLEAGNIATGWTPASDDYYTQNDINDLLYYHTSGFFAYNEDLNTWEKSDPAKSAFKNINFVAGHNQCDYFGVADYEIIEKEFSVIPHTQYRIGFEFKAAQPIDLLSTATINYVPFRVNTSSLLNGQNRLANTGDLATIKIMPSTIDKQSFHVDINTGDHDKIYLSFNFGILKDTVHYYWDIDNLYIQTLAFTHEDTYSKGEIDDKIKNAGQVKRVNGINPDPSGNINIGSQIVRAYDAFAKSASQVGLETIGGSWLVDQAALGSIVDRINELGQRDLPANTDLNTFKVPGNWTIHNQAPYQNLPDDEKWETLLVFAPLGNSNGMQVLLETNKERIIYRTWNSGAFKNWHVLIDDSLFNQYTFNDANTGIWNTTIDCNDYLGETHIWKLGNVAFRNGPIAGNHWGWLRTLRYDGNTIVQFYIDGGGQIWWRQTNDRGIRAAVWQRLLDTNDSTNLQNQINNLNNRMNSALTSYTTNNLQDGINHSNQNPNQIVFVTN